MSAAVVARCTRCGYNCRQDALGLYSAERCILDAFRLGHREGHAVAAEALRRWLQRRGAAPAELLAMARHFPKVEPSLLHALRILA